MTETKDFTTRNLEQIENVLAERDRLREVNAKLLKRLQCLVESSDKLAARLTDTHWIARGCDIFRADLYAAQVTITEVKTAAIAAAEEAEGE